MNKQKIHPEEAGLSAPLQTACAEGRHYACGAKACSCECHLRKKQPTRASAMLIVIWFMVLAGASVWMSTRGVGAKPTTKQSGPELNEHGLKFATSSLVQDLEMGLTGGKSGIGGLSEQDLLTWARLDAKVNASAYEAAYDNNEISADNQYKGKKLLITGIVNRIDKDFTDSGHIWLDGSGALGIHAALNEQGMVAAAAFNRGQKVNLVCTGDGSRLTVASLANCAPLNSYLVGLRPDLEARVKDFLARRLQFSPSVAQLIASMYEFGTLLPANSPCMKADLMGCDAEIDELQKNPQTVQIIKARTQNLLGTLKMK
jgi:tRNA_anti-like